MIACSFPGKIGDALYSLPTVKKLSETYGEKVDFYTSSYCAGLKRLVEYQPYINKFIVPDNYRILRYDLGIQPWRFEVDETQYTKVFHLGYRSIPNKSLHKFIAEQAGVQVDSIQFYYPEFETLDEPYVVLAPHNDVRYLNTFREFINQSPIPVVIVGSKDEYLGVGIDKTGLDFLEVLTWIAHSKLFIGMSSNFVLAEGFDIPKLVPHDGRTFDMRHLLYDHNHFYPINPTVKELIARVKIMKTFSKTLNTEDYATLGGHLQHFVNILDHFKTIGFNKFRFEHEHRKWEYALVYKALDSVKAKKILDVGGGGSLLAPALAWVDMDVLTVDEGDVGSWIEEQVSRTSKPQTFMQKNFMDFESATKFDAVISVSTIEHVVGDEEFFKKLLTFVKEGGLIVLTTDFHPSGTAQVSGHVKTYNKESMLKLAEIAKAEGFEFYGGEPDYDYFAANVNGCDFASLVMIRKEKKSPEPARKKASNSVRTDPKSVRLTSKLTELD